MGKNRRKIGINRRKIAEKSGRSDFASCCRAVLCTRGAGASGLIISPIYRRKSQKIAFYRLIFGVFSANILALGFLAVSDLTVQISSALFEKSNGYIFDQTVDFKSEA